MLKYKGFSLIEMAIVLLIVSILLGGVLVPLSMQREIEQIKTTDKDLLQIREALIGYAIQNQRLPCPDTDDDGIENNSCNAIGALPWADLGVDKKDIWGKVFVYRVDTAFSRKPHITTLTTESNLQLKYYSNTINVEDNIAAIVFSRGKNQHADGDNGDNDITLVNNSGSFSYNTAASSDTVYAIVDESNFDDQLIWLSTPLLVQRLVAAEQWHKSLE
jgi:prepilin-type N-terminal cleavage/methylation domain-containing protein